jgi:hypothetical protein
MAGSLSGAFVVFRAQSRKAPTINRKRSEAQFTRSLCAAFSIGAN